MTAIHWQSTEPRNRMTLPAGTITSGDQSLHSGLRAWLDRCLIRTWYAVYFNRLTTMSRSVQIKKKIREAWMKIMSHNSHKNVIIVNWLHSKKDNKSNKELDFLATLSLFLNVKIFQTDKKNPQNNSTDSRKKRQ